MISLIFQGQWELNKYKMVGFNEERKRQEMGRWRVLNIKEIIWEVENNGDRESWVLWKLKRKILKH